MSKHNDFYLPGSSYARLREYSKGPQGRLRVFKQYNDGSKEKIFEEDNLIVTLGKSILLGQLFYTVGGGDPLSYAKVGIGGALDPEGNFLKVPTADMSDLYTPVGTAAIIKTDEDITIPSITLLANVDNSVANGQFINEAGFFSVSGKMFNIKTFPGILKDSSFSIVLEWVIRML